MNRASSIRSPRLWIVLAVAAAPLALPGVTLQGDETPAPKKEWAELIFRGAERAEAGKRFTLEVIVLNPGATPLKDVDFQATLGDGLELPSKSREHRAAIETIAPDDVHVVRIPLTARKAGTGGVDIVLKSKAGATQRMSYVMPVAAEASLQRPDGSGLNAKIEMLTPGYVDRPGVVLVNVVNHDHKAMANKVELLVSHVTMMKGETHAPQRHLLGVASGKHKALRSPFSSSNAVRQQTVTLPALEAGESITLPVRLTPRRIGELGVAVMVKDSVDAAVARGHGSANALGTACFSIAFDPAARIEKLLPTRAGAAVPTKLPRTLADVPEVSIEDPHAKTLPADEAFEHVAHLIEKIRFVNANKTDAYIQALIDHRSDVRGLPFTMGDACRLPADRGQHFVGELSRLRAAMTQPATLASHLPNPGTGELDAAVKARVAALVQVVEPEGAVVNREMAKYLGKVSHIDATRTLAKLAITADDQKVRDDALAALANRHDKDFTEVLVNGLDYPWPAVAEHAAEAIVKLKRTDLASKLVDVLDRPDPRAPRDQDGKHVVREVVRVNHLQNCLLCHAPANAAPVAAVPQQAVRGDIRIDANGLTAPVPLPNQPLPQPTPHGGYGHFTIPDTLVAIDVTYLRQDFSAKLPVAGAQPWPDQQRFDFLVRTREVTEQEAQAYRDLLRPAAAGDLSPYRKAAVAALRELTGRDAEPTAAAWRAALAQGLR